MKWTKFINLGEEDLKNVPGSVSDGYKKFVPLDLDARAIPTEHHGTDSEFSRMNSDSHSRLELGGLDIIDASEHGYL